MNKNWPTKEKDMDAAKLILEQYIESHPYDSLGLFEVIIDEKSKSMNFRLASWVVTLADHFKSMYGSTQGDLVTRQVITYCLAAGQTIH